MKISKFIGSINPEGVWVDGPEGSKLKILDPNTRRGQYAIGASMTVSEISEFASGDIDQTTPEGKAEAEKRIQNINNKLVGDLAGFEARTTTALLIDWTGVLDDDGKEVKFSKEIAIDLVLMSEEFKAALNAGIAQVADKGKAEAEKKEEVKKS